MLHFIFITAKKMAVKEFIWNSQGLHKLNNTAANFHIFFPLENNYLKIGDYIRGFNVLINSFMTEVLTI